MSSLIVERVVEPFKVCYSFIILIPMPLGFILGIKHTCIIYMLHEKLHICVTIVFVFCICSLYFCFFFVVCLCLGCSVVCLMVYDSVYVYSIYVIGIYIKTKNAFLKGQNRITYITHRGYRPQFV